VSAGRTREGTQRLTRSNGGARRCAGRKRRLRAVHRREGRLALGGVERAERRRGKGPGVEDGPLDDLVAHARRHARLHLDALERRRAAVGIVEDARDAAHVALHGRLDGRVGEPGGQLLRRGARPGRLLRQSRRHGLRPSGEKSRGGSLVMEVDVERREREVRGGVRSAAAGDGERALPPRRRCVGTLPGRRWVYGCGLCGGEGAEGWARRGRSAHGGGMRLVRRRRG
jgi:hypothetical protein